MDFVGLAWGGFPVNRPLSEGEKKRHFSQKAPSPSEPWYQLSVIRMNSVYLECVDKFFEGRGFVSWMGLWIAVPIALMFSTMLLTFPSRAARYSGWGFARMLVVETLLCIAFALFIWFGSWVIRQESFRYTHYPMCFNRKTRKAYFFCLNGKVVSEDWDKLYFTLGFVAHGAYEVQCHILAEDGDTVLHTFGLTDHGTQNDPTLYSQFEFIRRYMDDGPQGLVDQVEHVMEIAEQRETFWNGFQRLMADYGRAPLLGLIMAPIIFTGAIARCFSMITSKIPVWPEEVMRECHVDPDDPYLRDPNHLAEPGTAEAPVVRLMKRQTKED